MIYILTVVFHNGKKRIFVCSAMSATGQQEKKKKLYRAARLRTYGQSAAPSAGAAQYST